MPLIACGHFERSVLTTSLLEILRRWGLIYMNIESINIFCGNVVKKRTAEEDCAYFWDPRDKTGRTDLNWYCFCYRFLVCTAEGLVPPERKPHGSTGFILSKVFKWLLLLYHVGASAFPTDDPLIETRLCSLFTLQAALFIFMNISDNLTATVGMDFCFGFFGDVQRKGKVTIHEGQKKRKFVLSVSINVLLSTFYCVTVVMTSTWSLSQPYDSISSFQLIVDTSEIFFFLVFVFYFSFLRFLLFTFSGKI